MRKMLWGDAWRMLWGMGLAAKCPGLDEKKLRPKAGGHSAWRCPRRSPGVLLRSTNRFKPHPEKKIKWHHLALGEFFPLPSAGRG